MESDLIEYQNICQKLRISPIQDVLDPLSRRQSSICISESSIKHQNDEHLQAIFRLLEFNFLTDLSISQQSLSTTSMTKLAAGISATTTLKKLTLKSNKFADIQCFSLFAQALQVNSSLGLLDLSHNGLNDESVNHLCEYIETNTNLTILILDSNQITNSRIAASLSINESIHTVSLCNNPLSFDALNSILDMLTVNRKIVSLHLSGIVLEGSAPLKENSSGHLSKVEAMILKLAYVLRYSTISAISIEIDPNCVVQLGELERTLTKYNRRLTTINSSLIN